MSLFLWTKFGVYCQRQSCKAFMHWPIIRVKMVRGERPLLRENLAETDQPI